MRQSVRWIMAGAAAFFCSSLPLAEDAMAAGEVVQHTVRAGDNLHLIAGYYFKDPRQWKKIYRLNKKNVRNASLLEPGTVIRVEVEPGRPWDIPYENFMSRVRRR